MARTKEKDSKSSLLNLGLKPHEDAVLKSMLEDRGISASTLCRALLRQWIKEGGEGAVKYSEKFKAFL